MANKIRVSKLELVLVVISVCFCAVIAVLGTQNNAMRSQLDDTLHYNEYLIQDRQIDSEMYQDLARDYYRNRATLEQLKSHCDSLQKVYDDLLLNPTVIEVLVEKVTYEPYPVRDFKSLGEFSTWMEDKFVKLMSMTGRTTDCDDYAIRLQRKAAREGYLISICFVENGRVLGKRVSDDRELHLGNLVVIGNGIYYVEPQLDKFRIVRLCARD